MTRLLVPALVAAAALIGAGWWYTSQTSTPEVTAAASVAERDESSAIHPLDFPLGNKDADVVVVEYSSLTCPHCATFSQNVFPQIEANFIDTGDILYLKREVYFDRYGLWAAMVARCGGDRYHGMLELIYQNQSHWAGSNDPAEVVNRLRRLGRQAGMDDAQLDTCLEDGDKALELTEFYQANAERDGINSTPTFVINGERHSNMSYADFESLLNAKLGR